MEIASYPKVFAIGHAAIEGIFSDEIHMEEKIDGSQFSFMKNNDGTLVYRSKGAVVLDGAAGMFTNAVETVKAISDSLVPGYVYRCEYLSKPKHNTLLYDRIPEKYLILFDVNIGMETYMSYDEKRIEANRIGLECVPMLYRGKVESFDMFVSLLETVSVLGGQKIEGVVVKNYQRFSKDGKAMIGKYVSERFKEIHGKDFKLRNPSNSDILDSLSEQLKTVARWDKSIQHLREKGEVHNEHKDIGVLIAAIQEDVKDECEIEIKDKLFKWAWPKISRNIIKGFPEYYKETLAKSAFTVEGE